MQSIKKISLACCIALPIYVQAQPEYCTVGVSVQAYPAGFIITGTFNQSINQRSSLLYRAGVNIADRKDFSPFNNHESGTGVGGSFGYIRQFYLTHGYLMAGIHTDVWNMWINWQNNNARGTSYTLVFQPWVEFGYVYPIPKKRVEIGISTGFGREINVITKGNKVGEGWMNSLLLHARWKLHKR